MFYDERIEYEKGRISRNCIILAVILSLIYGALYITNVTLSINAPTFRHFMFVGMEAAVAVLGIASLITGGIMGALSRDELAKRKKFAFYSKAGAVIIYTAAVLWAELLPLSLMFPMPSVNFSAYPFDYGVYIMSVPLLIYVVYSFKKRDIYFNYSILESDDYYRGVFKNIGKLALFMLGMCFASVFLLSVFLIKQGAAFLLLFLSVFITYLKYFATVSVYYILVSMAEKGSYDNETKLVSKSTVIVVMIAACLAIFGIIAKICGSWAVTELTRPENDDILNELSRHGLSIGLIIAYINLFVEQIFTSAITVGMFGITYVYYEYRRAAKSRLFGGFCGAFLATGSARAFICPCFSVVIAIINTVVHLNWEKYMGSYPAQKVSSVFADIKTAFGIALLIILMLMIYALAKDGVIGKLHLISIPAIAAGYALLVFLSTQIDHYVLTYFTYSFTAVIYLYCFAVTLILSKKNVYANA